MRSRKVMKWLAAAAVGAMMLVPMTVSARTYDGEMKGKNPEFVVPHKEELKEAVNMAVTVEDKWDNVKAVPREDVVILQWTNALKAGKMIILEVSSDSSFPDNSKTENHYIYDYDSYQASTSSEDVSEYDGANTREINGYLAPGTNYVRAFICEGDKYGPVSTTLAVNVPVGDVYVEEQEVKENSVKFRFHSTSASGFEIQRKVGSKYKKIGKTTDNVFTDKGLEKGKTYSYRMRGYAYDASTGKNVYGDWAYEKVTTWGNALKLQATSTGKKAVKLTWKKVNGADGYEIYRSATGTNGSDYKFAYEKDEEGYEEGYSDDYSTYELIKTIKSAKTKKYTDKKLDEGAFYSYKVVAYKNKNGKKDVIVESKEVGVDLDFRLSVNEVTINKDHTKTVKWQKVEGADGYKVEKQIAEDKDGNAVWATVAQFPASQKSCVIPTCADEFTRYRIYAFKGTKNSNVKFIEASKSAAGELPASDGVVAVQRADGGVDISWRPVAGATSYTVYRCTTLNQYEALTGQYKDQWTNFDRSYKIPGTVKIYTTEKEADGDIEKTSVLPASQLSITDIYGTYKRSDNKDEKREDVLNEGPQLGKTYYYYVYAEKKEKVTENNVETEKITSSTSTTYAKVTLSTKVSLKKPAIKTIKSSKKGEVKLSWKKVTGAKAYYVYVKTGKKDYMCVGSTDKKNITVSGLESGKSYTFKVAAAAVNEAGAETVAKKGSTNKVKYSDAKSVKVK